MQLIKNIISTLLLANIALALFVLLAIAQGASGDDLASQFIKWELLTIINFYK